MMAILISNLFTPDKEILKLNRIKACHNINTKLGLTSSLFKDKTVVYE